MQKNIEYYWKNAIQPYCRNKIRLQWDFCPKMRNFKIVTPAQLNFCPLFILGHLSMVTLLLHCLGRAHQKYVHICLLLIQYFIFYKLLTRQIVKCKKMTLKFLYDEGPLWLQNCNVRKTKLFSHFSYYTNTMSLQMQLCFQSHLNIEKPASRGIHKLRGQ